MEQLAIKNIPKDEIYKICILDSAGKPIKLIIFQGNANPPSNIDELFSEEVERLKIKIDQPAIHYSEQYIHKDDSIQIIKNKIINELGANTTSYEELYLFSIKQDNLHLPKAFREMTNNETRKFTKSMCAQLLFNLQIKNKDTVVELLDNNKMQYAIDDITKEFPDVNRKYDISIPIGRRFLRYRDLLFSSNPFTILQSNEYAYQPSVGNTLITFDNNVLLNWDTSFKVYAFVPVLSLVSFPI